MILLWSLSSLVLTQASPTTIELWHSSRGGEAAVLTQLCHAYEQEHPGIVVHLVSVPFDNMDDKLLEALLAHQPPDLFIASHSHLQSWARYLSPMPRIGTLAIAEQAVTFDGRPLAIPFSMKTLALIRNRTLLPHDLADMSELDSHLGEAKQLLGFDTISFYFFSPFFFAQNTELFTAAGGLDIQNQSALATWGWLRRVTAQPGYVSRGLDHVQLVNEFRAGHIAALIDGPWVLADLGPLDQVATQALPRFSPDRDHPATIMRPFLTVDALFVPREATSVTAATALAIDLASPKNCDARREIGSQLAPFATCAIGWSESDRRLLGGFFDEAEHSLPMPTSLGMGAAWEPLSHLLSAAVHSDQSITAAAAAATAEFARYSVAEPVAPLWLDLVAGGVLALILGQLYRQSRRRRQAHTVEAEVTSTRTVVGFLLPSVLVSLPLIFIPLVLGMVLSVFAHHSGRFNFVGVGNFMTLLGHLDFYTTLGVTVLWTALNLACHIVLGISLALLLNTEGLGGRGLFRALLIIPWAMPNYISALVWHNLFNYQLGAINQLLVAIHISPVDWFASFAGSMTANVTTNAWLGFPFILVITLGALQSIPSSLKEAMALDGASRWQTFRHLTLPTIAPQLVPALLISAIWTFNMFNVIYLVSGGGPRGQTDILISDAYRWAFERGARYGYAAAYCVAIFVILLGLTKLKDSLSQKVET